MLKNGIGPDVCQRSESSWFLPPLACSLLPRTGHVNKSLPTKMVALGHSLTQWQQTPTARTGLQETPTLSGDLE